MRNILALIVFIVLQILFIPLAIIGGIWVVYKQVVVSKRLGISQTAIEIINGRWTMHVFGLCDDSGASKLTPVLPSTSTIGLGLALFPLYVHSRIRGENKWYPTIAEKGQEGVSNLIMNRTIYFDSIIEKASHEARQFVILGAGFDTRAYGNLKNSEMKIFECDQVATQQLKRKYLQKAGLDTSHVTFVEVDFAQDNWFSALESAGYDSTKRTIFLWEGVTLYLNEASVRNTLQTLKANAVSGSTIALDIYSKSFVTGDYMPGMKATLPLLDMTDEQLTFGLVMTTGDYQKTLETFVSSEGMSVGETYFMGHKTEKGAWMVVAELQI